MYFEHALCAAIGRSYGRYLICVMCKLDSVLCAVCTNGISSLRSEHASLLSVGKCPTRAPREGPNKGPRAGPTKQRDQQGNNKGPRKQSRHWA